MDSRATLQEILFRVKLVIVVALIGALVGAVVCLLYITDRGHDLQYYFFALEVIFTDDKYIAVRRDILLSAVTGALYAILPVIYIYNRRAK
jgi:hypothetical protein